MEGHRTDLDERKLAFARRAIRDMESGSTDPGSGINRYLSAIGTTAGATDIVDWTDNGTAPSPGELLLMEVRCADGMRSGRFYRSPSGQVSESHRYRF